MNCVDRTLDNLEIRIKKEARLYRECAENAGVVRKIPANSVIKIWNYDLPYYYEVTYYDEKRKRLYQGFIPKRQLNQIVQYRDIDAEERIAQ